MPKKLVQVKSYERNLEECKIEVDCVIFDLLQNVKSTKVFVVDSINFNLFLILEGKLEYELNYSEAGEHIQQSGTMSSEEYWEHGLPYVNTDLEEYISLRFKNAIYSA